MKRTTALAVLSFLFFSCSGYFDDRNSDNSPGLAPLAIQGGGYLSSDTGNDITPFVYHDSSTSKNWLFFASDREGDYNIYYSEMNKDGTFKSVDKLGSVINTSYPEFSPVLFVGSSGTTNLFFIAFLRISGGITNLMMYRLDSNFMFFSSNWSITNLKISGISIMSPTNNNGYPKLLCAIGSSNWLEMSWSGSSVTNWYTNFFTTNFIPGNKTTIRSVAGYANDSGMGYTNYYIQDLVVAGKGQIYSECLIYAYYASLYSTNSAPIPFYASIYDDRDPFVDPATKQVYFSSSRIGSYDLYRYNYLTYDLFIP